MPRGRPRKPRLSRMDAAVDAMLPFGFSEEKVRKHVKELLKEYGGDEGWPFIEEYSYKELIDAILRDADDQEQVAEAGNQLEDQSCGDEKLAGTSSRASNTQQDERPQDNAPADIIVSSGAVAELTCPEFVCSISGINNAEADGKGWKDILPDLTSGHIDETANVVSENDKDPPTKVRSPRITRIPASPSLNSVPSLPQTNSRRHLLPCYGWIESDEDDHDDFVFLKPASAVLGAKATPPRELSKCLSDVTKLKRKRRSRWDLRPDDP